jgi:cysteine desulfuration protein SufE
MMDVDEIVSIFDLLGDWEQRYHYLVEVGEQLPPMPEQHKTETNRVKGCMSQVWIKAYWDPGSVGLVRYHGDCDTAIIKGVLALMVNLFSGRTTDQIVEIDADELFGKLRLAEHLSPSRHFGVYAIVELMKQQAAELVGRSYQAA